MFHSIRWFQCVKTKVSLCGSIWGCFGWFSAVFQNIVQSSSMTNNTKPLQCIQDDKLRSKKGYNVSSLKYVSAQVLKGKYHSTLFIFLLHIWELFTFVKHSFYAVSFAKITWDKKLFLTQLAFSVWLLHVAPAHLNVVRVKHTKSLQIGTPEVTW